MAVRARTSFAVPAGVFSRVVAEGDVFSDTDPVVKGREAFFEPVDGFVDRVERATANPGEVRDVVLGVASPGKRSGKRSVGRPKKAASEEGVK